MDYKQVLEQARGNIGPYCKACPVCNGKRCKNQIPGPGAKGNGDVAIRNYDKWQEIRINMDTLCENVTPDTSVEIFGKKFDLPVFAGPVGAVKLHYGEKYTDEELAAIIQDDSRPIFVARDELGVVMGYVFCVYQQYVNNNILTDVKTLYIDDLCVEETLRGQHVGKQLYDYVLAFAKENGFYNVTLNVLSV